MSYKVNDVVNLKWTTTFLSASAEVVISLLDTRNNQFGDLIKVKNTGSATVTLPKTLSGISGNLGYGNVYKINVIYKISGTSEVRSSSDLFSITPAPSLATLMTASVANSFDSQNSPDMNSYSSALNNNLTCTTLPKNIQYRDNDVSSGGAVSKLQAFLKAKGYLAASVSGSFGDSTFGAVKSFQIVNGLEETGYVGVMTRSKIKDLSCQSSF